MAIISLIDFMINSILESCQSSYVTHRIAEMYVKVSSRYIMKDVCVVVLSTTWQRKLVLASCREAFAGILQMVKEDKMEMIQQIQEHNEKLKNEF